jgi:hypothetical protein
MVLNWVIAIDANDKPLAIALRVLWDDYRPG